MISLGFLGRGGRGVAKDHGILQVGVFLRGGQSSVVGLGLNLRLLSDQAAERLLLGFTV